VDLEPGLFAPLRVRVIGGVVAELEQVARGVVVDDIGDL